MSSQFKLPKKGDIDHCQSLIQQMLGLPGHFVVTVAIPETDVGRVIGKGGHTNDIEKESGAKIEIPDSSDLDNPDVRTVRITHLLERGAILAKKLIEDKLSSRRTIKFEIPEKGEF